MKIITLIAALLFSLSAHAATYFPPVNVPPQAEWQSANDQHELGIGVILSECQVADIKVFVLHPEAITDNVKEYTKAVVARGFPHRTPIKYLDLLGEKFNVTVLFRQFKFEDPVPLKTDFCPWDQLKDSWHPKTKSPRAPYGVST